MRLTTLALITGTLAFAAPAAADTFSCRARVALNRVYDATVDLESGWVSVVNDAGTNYAGTATRSASGTTGDVSYFLATGFGAGIELAIENGDVQRGRKLLCLAANECYACR